MELKDIIFIVWKRKSIFLFVLFSVILLAIFGVFIQPEKYKIVFPLDISRNNYQKTDDYRYDQFYRLQADEKFSETVVRWIGAPDFGGKVRADYKEDVFSMENLRAEKLSPGYIQISFNTKDEKKASSIASSIKKVLDKKNNTINKESADPNWFSFVFGDVTISKQQIDYKLIILGAILVGFVLGLFASLFHYYWQSNENWN